MKAGYMEQWVYHKTYSGTPQGSGMSPILANIYLSELDTFMEQYKERFDLGGKNRRVTKEYSRMNGAHERLRKKYNTTKDTLPEAERKELSKQLRQVQLELCGCAAAISQIPKEKRPCHAAKTQGLRVVRRADDRYPNAPCPSTKRPWK